MQQQPGEAGRPAEDQPGQRPPARFGAEGGGRVEAADEPAGGDDVGLRRGPRTGDDRGQYGAEFGDAHPPQEGRADHQYGGGRLLTVRGADRVGAERRVAAVLQPAVAVGGEGYRRGGGHLQPVGEVAHQPVQVGGGVLADRDGGADRGPRPRHREGEPRRGEEDQDGDGRDQRAGRVPDRPGEHPGGGPGEQDDGEGRREQGEGHRPAAHPQHGDGPGARHFGTRLRTHT